MINHIILTVSDVERSLVFYDAALKPLNIRYLTSFGWGSHRLSCTNELGAPRRRSQFVDGHHKLMGLLMGFVITEEAHF